MNILFIATYGDFLATFEYSNIKLWLELGHTVHCAANFAEKKYNLKTIRLEELGVKLHEIGFERVPFKKRNINEYKKLIKLIKEEKIDVIDTHNAVASAFSRLAASKCNINKVIYTPHSFFFYKGCDLKKKLIFKNVEKILSRKTDLLITINKEDFDAAKQMKVRGKVLYVPGVGIDTKEIMNLPIERAKYCEEFSIPINAKIFVSVGELIERKNHITAIKAFAKANIPNSYYLICGIGKLEEKLKDEIEKLQMTNRIKLLGYRIDAKNIMKMADIFLFPSLQEGLPVALMEAMACGLPAIVSNIRGNIDLIQEQKGGWLFEPADEQELCNIIKESISDVELCKNFKNNNLNLIETFDIKNVREIMKKEYKNLIIKG